MNSFLKLVNFEINRFIKIYLVLAVLTIVLQFTAVISTSLGYIHNANKVIYEQSISKAQFIAEYGPLTFTQICKSMWFVSPIAISAVVILGYIFLIWYRDWFARNTFIYRLLMLPTSRLNIYFSKSAAILLFVLGLIALEIIILPFEILLFEKMVPGGFRLDLPINEVIAGFYVLYAIIPRTFIQFLLYYGMGLMAVFILFTGILFERSFGWKGILPAVLYAAVSIFIFNSPTIFLISSNSQTFVYPGEFIALEIGLGIIVILSAVSVSGYLLKKKITV